MLQVAVHDCEQRSGGREHALDARRRQPAPSDALHAAHPTVTRPKGTYHRSSSICRIIVDEDHFPAELS
jgi:hypothetical protein